MMVYRRNIRKNMLYCLKRLYERFGTGWAKTNSIDERKLITSDFEKLKYWNLIRSENGRHRITDMGIDFLYGKVGIQKYFWIYDGKVQDTPAGATNPIIFSHDIDPEIINKGLVLEHATPRKVFKNRQEADLFVR
jgi:hypothetical protein